MAQEISNSSKAKKVTLKCKRGDTFKRTFRFWQDSDRTIPADITNISFRMSVVNPQTGDPILSFSLGIELTITAPNILVAEQTPDVMKDCPTGTFEWDMERTLAGNVFTKMEGPFIIDKDGTR